MSHQSSGRLAIIPARAVDDRALTPALFRVLGALGCYGNRDGWAGLSLALLAERLGITKQTVGASLRDLERLGYLTKTAQFRSDGSQRVNLYRLLLDASLPVDRDRRPQEADLPAEEEPDDGVPPDDFNPHFLTGGTAQFLTGGTALGLTHERPMLTSQENVGPASAEAGGAPPLDTKETTENMDAQTLEQIVAVQSPS